MLAIPSSVRARLAAGHSDVRCGMQGLALPVKEGLHRNRRAGDLFALRRRHSALVKIIWRDGLSLSLYDKLLDRQRFIWPVTTSVTAPVRSHGVPPASPTVDVRGAHLHQAF